MTKSNFRAFPEDIEGWLHKELMYIRNEVNTYRGKFNFSFLTELAEKEFGRSFDRSVFRRFALRYGYYHALPEEKGKVYTRFETSGPGVLYQHNSSHHLWLPLTGERHALILTEDDYSRKVLSGKAVNAESTWEHLILTLYKLKTFATFLHFQSNNP